MSFVARTNNLNSYIDHSATIDMTVSHAIDDYRVQIESPVNALLSCGILFHIEGERVEPFSPEEIQQACDRARAYPNTVLPSFIGASPREFYAKRTEYVASNYPAQNFVLIMALGHFSDESVEVTRVIKRDSTFEVTVEVNKYIRDSAELTGSIVQVDLAYLEPNDYNVIINRHHKKDGILSSFSQETISFKVYEPN